MNILKNTSSRLLSTLLLFSIILTLTSCFGFSEQDPSIPNVKSVEITGETAADLAILVSWTASDNSGGYNIYRSEDGGSFLYTGSTGPEQLSYIDANEDLVLGNSYAYKVSSYNIWHTAESDKSSTTAGIDFFLTPVWESIFSQTSDSPIKIKIANSPANQLYFVYADSVGFLHVGRVIEEENPDDEDETIFNSELLDDVLFTPKVNPTNPDFDIIYTNNALYIGFADADESDQLTVMKITTDTDDDDLITWEFANFGTAGFTSTSVSSISLAASGGGFTAAGTLYVGNINGIELQVWERPLDASSGTLWEDVSPNTALLSVTPEKTKLFMDGSNVSLAYNKDSPDANFDILSRSSSDVWSTYDSLPLEFAPMGSHFTVGTSGNLLTVFSLESGNNWNIQTRDDDDWVDQDNTTEFSAVSSGITAPFSSALTASNMYLLGAKTTGIELLMYDRDIEKWFSYGNPSMTGPITSPQLVAANNSYYAAWIEGSEAHILIGR
jgi:hypothetical protein